VTANDVKTYFYEDINVEERREGIFSKSKGKKYLWIVYKTYHNEISQIMFILT